MKRKGATAGPALYNGITNRSGTSEIVQLRTVEHYLLECRNYREQRKELKREVGTGKMRVGSLLGDPTLIKCTLKYIKETGSTCEVEETLRSKIG